MPATYTFDVFSTLDGFGSYTSSGDWSDLELIESRTLDGRTQELIHRPTRH